MVLLIRIIMTVVMAVIVVPASLWSEEDDSHREIVRPEYGETRQNKFDVFPYREIKRPKIGLVLSGGGARGIAHLGVIEVFEEHGIPIDFISGASMGSLIGGLYALGYSTDALNALVDTTDWDRILALTDAPDRRDLFVDQKITPRRGLFTLRFDGIVPVIPSAVTPAQRLSNFINQLVLQGVYHPFDTFDDMRIPFRTVASDIVTGNRVVFDRGDLVQALRASISIPLVFAPVKLDDMLLVDGGLVANIPVDIATEYGCDIIVAVNTTSGMRTADQIGAPWEVADQIITIMQQRWNRDQLALADVIITPPIENYLGTDFNRMQFFLSEGRKSAEDVIPVILEKIEHYYTTQMESDTVVYYNPSFSFSGTGTNEYIKRAGFSFSEQDEISRRELISQLNTLYETGWFSNVYASVDHNKTETMITIYTEIYPVLREVIFEGNAYIPTDTLQALFSDVVDNPTNNRNVKQALEQVVSVYRSKGYSIAKITSTDFDAESGQLTITIDEGVINEIVYEGNQKTRGYVIRREFPLQQGDIFQVDQAMRGVRNITGTGLFDQVLINVDDTDGQSQLIVKVDERHSELIRLSMRIDEAYHFQPLIEVRNENLFGHGMETGLSIGGGLDNRVLMTDYIAHRIFDTYLSSRIAAFYQFEDIPVYIDDPESLPTNWVRIEEGEYRQRRMGANISLGAQFERLGNVSGTLRLENHKIEEKSPGDFNPAEYRFIAYRLASMFDTFDRYPYPNEGVGIHAYYESGSSLLGSDVSYSKFFVSYESYSTFYNYHTFRPRIMFGFGDETLPLSEQFSLGGKSQFYGLREYDSRGRQIFLLNIEYRLKLPFRILVDTYLHARYDVGAIWTTQQDIHMRDLMHGIGIGLGFDTTILGPIEIAIGRAYQNRGDIIDQTVPSGPLQTYFSIGYPLPL